MPLALTVTWIVRAPSLPERVSHSCTGTLPAGSERLVASAGACVQVVLPFWLLMVIAAGTPLGGVRESCTGAL